MAIQPPTGTVTFLFSDIESSTRQWENHEEWMQRAWHRQEQIIREAMAACGGYVYKMVGDAFQVAFATARDAVTAAIAAQRALQSEDWGEFGPIRVRMALHTGVTEERGDDYVGPLLNRVARLLSAGHGGQILLTQATHDLVQDDLPPGATLKDLGEHRLKDLVRPEHVYQLSAEGLENNFPRLKSLSNLPNNLPVPVTSFVGREQEIEEVRGLLERSRLVTITGPGGTGKTRLALQVAGEMLEHFPDGVFLIELGALTDPQLVAQSAASVLGVSESPGVLYSQAVADYLRLKQMLLIFDNCEHVIEESARFIEMLLQGCPQLRVMTTSREILGAAGEVNYRCPSLSLPDLRRPLPFEELAATEAVRLFAERAASAQPGFTLTPQNISTVARICQRLDGIPLAIELAAARVRMLSLEGIAARLDDAFRLLTGGSRTVLPRQQTLRALIDWSYNLLSPAERTLFLRLSVFAGGLTLDAAEWVCADPVEDQPAGDDGVSLQPEDILNLLGQLVDKSLVQPAPMVGGEPRYRLLETIRQYARERLSETGGGAAVRDRHLAYYLLMGEEAEPHLRGRDQVAWLDRLEAELDNLRIVLEWALASDLEAGLRLSSALMWFWHIRGYAGEGAEWLERLLAAEAEAAATKPRTFAMREARARALTAAGMNILFRYQAERGKQLLEESAALYREMGPAGRRGLAIAQIYLASAGQDWERRIQYASEALEVLRETNDHFYLAEALMILGHILMEKNEYAQARPYFEESLALRRRLEDMDGLGIAYTDMGVLTFSQGDWQKAVHYFQKSLECFQAVGNLRLVSNAQSALGTMAMFHGDYQEAAEQFEAAIHLAQETGDKIAEAQALSDLGRLAWEQGDYPQAARRFEELLTLGREIDSKVFQAIGMCYLAGTLQRQGEVERAYRTGCEAIRLSRSWSGDSYDHSFVIPALGIMGEILVVRGQYERAVKVFGMVDHSTLWNLKLLTPGERASYEERLSAARAALGEEAYTAAWNTGQGLSIEEAVELALAG